MVVDRHAGIQQRPAAPARLRRDLARVVEVRLNPDLVGAEEQVDQFGVVEPLRQRHRHAGADADHVHVRRWPPSSVTSNFSLPTGSVSGSPPETITSRISGCSRTYSIIRWSLRLGASQPPRSMVARLRVQNRQYIVQTCVVTSSTRSG